MGNATSGGLRALKAPATSQHFSPWRLLVITICSIFVAEVIAMIIVYRLHGLPYPLATLVDAGLMVVLIFPVLYLFSLRPLIQQIRTLEQMERTLHQNEELQQRFFDSMDVMIAYMDRDFNFIKVNGAYALSAEGDGPDQFVGKNHFALYPDPNNREIFQRVVDTGIPYVANEKPFEYAGHPERGVTYWNWNLQPVKDPQGRVEGVVLSLVDVTKRKRAEQKAELESARLRSILDTMPDGIYIVNSQYEMEYANPVIERQFGIAQGRKCYSYAHDRASMCPWCHNEEVFAGQTAHWEWTEEATGKTYEVYEMPLTNADGTLSKLKLLHDVTTRKQAEGELQRRNEELQALTISERKQRQLAETLRTAAQELTQSLDLDVVLRTLLKHLRALVQSDTSSVIFLEGESTLAVRAVEGYEGRADPAEVLAVKLDADKLPQYRRLASTHRALVIPDTAADPEWEAFPGRDPMHSRLFAPILMEDKLVGVVGMGKVEPGYFNEEHMQAAEVLVGQAAAAIQNAWLFEQVRAGRERLQTLSRRLVEVQETERLYIARELHDQASQTLTSLIMELGMLEKEADQPEAVRARAVGLKQTTDHVLEELHYLAIHLRPTSLDHLGLAPALEQFIRTFSHEARLPIRLKTLGFEEDTRLPQEVETALYRIVQEALTNVARHAHATRADVVLERRGNSMLVIVEDDGRGFNANGRRQTGHLGLLGMQERVEMLGGTLTIESVPDQGTTVFAEVPYADTNTDRG